MKPESRETPYFQGKLRPLNKDVETETETTEPLETPKVQPILRTETRDCTKKIRDLRNWYRRNDKRYLRQKEELEQLGYTITEFNKYSLTVEQN